MAKRKHHGVGWWGGWGRLLAFLRLREMSLGDRGEAYAAKYLKKHDMKIIARQRRTKGGEIDLIGLEGKFVVFVEVRTRTKEDFMTPEASVRFWKKRAVTRAARRLMRRHLDKGLSARIDLVAIVWPAGAKEPTTVRHHKGAMMMAKW
jgi:putative endonuclease